MMRFILHTKADEDDDEDEEDDVNFLSHWRARRTKRVLLAKDTVRQKHADVR
jgi:hypothetical protein